MTEKMKQSLQFVTRFYSPGALRPDDSFIREGLPFLKRHAAAAATAGAALAAAAAVTAYIALHTPGNQMESPEQTVETIVKPIDEVPATETIKEMKFEDATLPEVVDAIEKAYGVKVTGETENQPSLTLSYRGTAEDLTAAINDLLGTNLRIEGIEQ